MTNISVTTYPRILKPKLYVFSHQGESKSIVKSPENSIFQALAIGFHWFFKLFFYNGFLWEIFFSESDISWTKNLRHMKFGMMKYHIMTFKNKVVAPSSGTGAILKKHRKSTILLRIYLKIKFFSLILHIPLSFTFIQYIESIIINLLKWIPGNQKDHSNLLSITQEIFYFDLS